MTNDFTFEALVASRQQWIADVLKPWCRAACWKELFKASQDWSNLAGVVDPQATLWTWAWSRFPALVEDGLTGINETYPVRVTTRDQRLIVGYPDNRASQHGKLRVLCNSTDEGGSTLSDAISIDDIVAVERVAFAS
jgi:hypothetical protein